MRLTFLGAAETVTGSRHLLETGQARYLLDCGLFQGVKTLRRRNWEPFPIHPGAIDAVILSHAHLDHSGYLPRLVRDGFRGPIYASEATRDLAEVLLLDSAYLQEADADYLNRHHLSKHQPALPLYTVEDAERAVKAFRLLHQGQSHQLPDGSQVQLNGAGHILGASTVTFQQGAQRIVFSGDLGRSDDPLMYAPEPVQHADYLILESTYGNREHDDTDVQAVLADVIERTANRGGTVVIPSFAVGRAQLILYHLWQLRRQNRLPARLPIYLDSPMAMRAVEIYRRHAHGQRLSDEQVRAMYQGVEFVADVEASRQLDTTAMPKIIVSASGMATGGRVLHHLKHYVTDSRSTVLFAGFQAPGTRGAVMLDGASHIKIHGEYLPVRADVHSLPMLSAHADADEIVGWLRGFQAPPRETFIVHGEPAAADALRLRIQDQLGWRCRVAQHGESVELG